MPKIDYLNTDLDLSSSQNLKPLVAELAEHGLDILAVKQGGDGLWYATIEARDCASADGPEWHISLMLDAMAKLSEDSRALWLSCSKIEFNIGYDCGTEPWAFNQSLSASVLSRIVSSKASIRVTLYPLVTPATSI